MIADAAVITFEPAGLTRPLIIQESGRRTIRTVCACWCYLTICSLGLPPGAGAGGVDAASAGASDDGSG